MTEYAFPEDLVPEVKTRWDALPAPQNFELPDDHTLQRVLETCYHASLRTVEQRPVRCVVAYLPITRRPGEPLLYFQHPVELADDQIVRLAPVADFRRTLIGWDHLDGGLRIWGLFEHGHAWSQYSAGDPPDALVGEGDLPPDCLMIAIEGPGTLSVSRGRRGLVRLRDGEIVVPQENPMRNVDDPLGYFFHELVEDLRNSPKYRDRLAVVDGGDGPSLLGAYTKTIAAILEQIRTRREGGSIVLAHRPLDAATAQVTYTVAERTGLADVIASYCESLHNLLRIPSPNDIHSELKRCRAETALRLTSQQLVRGINQISLLAGVDGAVLLDSHLRIQGFGVRFSVMLAAGTTVLDAATGAEYSCDQWGLRHQSVFSVCQQWEQALGLIVSHDGGVKAVKSVQGRLHLWDRILD